MLLLDFSRSEATLTGFLEIRKDVPEKVSIDCSCDWSIFQAFIADLKIDYFPGMV